MMQRTLVHVPDGEQFEPFAPDASDPATKLDPRLVDAAYRALRHDTPEPIRELVLICAGRIA
jgi:hypothetical protein